MNMGEIIANLKCIDDEFNLYSFERTAIAEACQILSKIDIQKETREVLNDEKL